MLEHHNQMIDTKNNQLNSSNMLLLEKMSNMDEHIDWAFIHAQRIHLNAQQVGIDLHRYQQSIAETGAFLRNMGNKGFVSPL
jgi:hypothetical protein